MISKKFTILIIKHLTNLKGRIEIVDSESIIKRNSFLLAYSGTINCQILLSRGSVWLGSGVVHECSGFTLNIQLSSL